MLDPAVLRVFIKINLYLCEIIIIECPLMLLYISKYGSLDFT